MPSRHGRVPASSAVVAAVVGVAALLTSCSSGPGAATSTTAPAVSTTAAAARGGVPPIRHVFLIVLENKSYTETWGPDPGAPYLGATLRAEGNLLSDYYATSHDSLGNYVAMVSGQPANPVTQADCVSDYEALTPPTVTDGIAMGVGCVYPPTVGTIATQLSSAGYTWKGYMESMGRPCQHPLLGQADPNVVATPTSLYATRHNPFVYFQAITDSPACAADDVPLTELPGDLAKVSTTPNFSFITPNLCDDGHDATCAAGGPAGFDGINTFLETWVPRITGSPAYKKNGLLLITFDEAESSGTLEDDSACCDEPPSISAPGVLQGQPGVGGPGGGSIGLLALSPYIKPGSTTATPYNHFSLLRSLEDIFGLPHLGEAAAPTLAAFGPDVYTNERGGPPGSRG